MKTNFELRLRHATFWVANMAMLLSGLSLRAELMAGRPHIVLNGKPAPPASSSSCGLVLVAGDAGPQVMFTERPTFAIMALEPGEEGRIEIPLGGIHLELQATAQAVPFELGMATVSLGLGEAEGQPIRMDGDNLNLTVRRGPTGSNTVLRLLARAGTSRAAILWRSVKVTMGGHETAILLSPGAGDVEACPAPVLPNLRPSLERFLVEWDWRMQDGIETERNPSTYAEAMRRLLRRAEALVHDREAQGLTFRIPPALWSSLQQEWKDLVFLEAPGDARWETLWRKAHQARRDLALANPLVGDSPLAFVKQVPSVFSHQLTQYYGSCARPGGGVFVLEKPGHSMATRALASELPQGSCQHLDIAPDGRRLLFSWCAVASTPRNREEHLDRFYHLYEVNVDGSGLKQLTSGEFDDFSPRYLPDGGIVFISTRRGGFHRCGRGPCPVYTLCLANADGSNPRPISWHETHEWDPAVLHDGHLIYTRWDYVDRHAVFYEQLWSARPDGSGVRIFYGNNTFNPVGIWEAQAVPGSDRIMATASAHHAMTAGSIILVDPAQAPDGPGPITRLTPDALFPESEAPVLQKPAGAWSAAMGGEKSPVTPPEAVRWPGHCYRSPYPLSERYFLAAYSFDPLIGEPTWNRANMFGLYLVDAFGNKELLYRDLNIASLWPLLARARTPGPCVTSNTGQQDLAWESLGAIVPSSLSPRHAGGEGRGEMGSGAQSAQALSSERSNAEGTFFLQDVHASWPALPQESIRALRIVQVLPKSTPHANTPTVGIAHASPGRQVLGTVPVEPDGSAYFRAPAGIPLSFQALDVQGQAIQIMRSVVYLQPGETTACIGCHEHRTTAPQAGHQPLALGRPPSSITPGPDGCAPLSYPRLVQPVLDRHCVRCHNAAKPDGKVQLTGEPQGTYTISYNVLAPRVSFSAWGGKAGDFRQVNSEPASQPGFFGARGSLALLKLMTNHYEVALPAEDRDRLVTWMDANALFYGTFDPQDQARQQKGELIAGPKIQ